MESLFSKIFASEYTEPEPTNAAEAVDVSALSTTIMTVVEHDQIFASIIDGTLSSSEVIRQNYERLVRDLAPITTELTKLKKDDLLQRISGYVRAADKKDYLVRCAIDTMMNSYGFLTIAGDSMISSGYSRESYIANNRTRLAGLTDEMVASYRQKHLDAQKKRIEHAEAVLESIKNPQTLDQFAMFFKHKGKDKLTPEQQLRYDSLIAEKLKIENEAKKAEAAKIEGSSVDAEVVLIKTKHTRDGHDLYVVRLDRRVEREEYNRLNVICKRLGGHYSSFRGNGATPGFQFKEEDNAQLFMRACHGENIDTLDQVKDREQQKIDDAAERLSNLSERSVERAENVLSQDRKTNTARRASQASAVENRARNELALAQTVQNVASAMKNGELEHLNGLRHITQTELLNSILKRAKYTQLTKECPEYSDRVKREGEPVTIETVFYVDYPKYYVDNERLLSVADKIGGVSGLKLLGKRLKKAHNACLLNSKVGVKDSFLDEICERVGINSKLVPDSWISTYVDRNRLSKMGIDTAEQLRMACREFINQLAEKVKPDAAIELERKLIGQKVGIDFFPTPSAEAERMVQIAISLQGSHVKDLSELDKLRFLEPHGGNGNIASEIRNAGYEPDVCEISSCLREVLTAKKFKIVSWDFLDLKDREYDCIVANPPFSNNQDIHHTRHAYSLLAPKGCLVTIIGEGAFSRSGHTETEFQQWLETIGAEIEILPEDTFSDDKLMVNTKARARRVTIVK